MLKTRLGIALTLIAAALAFAAPAVGQGPESDHPWEFTTTGKVVVVGNVFAEYDQLLRILTSHGLIDENNDWIGGDAHLVQTGNILPRSRDWRRLNNERFEHERVARLLMKLDRQAIAQGGRVHALYGMLEALMLRWRIAQVPREVQELWAEPDSQAKRDALAERWDAELVTKNAHWPESTQARLKRDHTNYMTAFYKPGGIELLERYGAYNAQTHSFDLNTEIARWFRSRNSIISINGVIYAYSGISPVMAGFEPRKPGGENVPLTIGQMNDLVRSRNNDPSLFVPVDTDNDGPIWWTGLVKTNAGGVSEYMQQIRQQFGAKAMVIGRGQESHTTHVGNVFFAESGLGSQDSRTKVNTLVIEGDHWTIFEERKPIEQGDFTPAQPVILEGGPDNPIMPGGGPPRINDPG